MTIIRYKLPISAQYDRAIYDSLGIQIVLGLLSGMVLDGGGLAQLCGMSMIAFWGGAAVLIYRHPHNPTRTDLELIRFGFFPVIVLTLFIAVWVWRLRGLG